MYRGVFIPSKSFINKEKTYVFLVGKLMSGDACTKSNKRITTFSHVLQLCDFSVTPNSRCQRDAEEVRDAAAVLLMCPTVSDAPAH